MENNQKIKDEKVKSQEINTSLIEERVQEIFASLNNCFSSNGLIDSVKLARSFGFEIVEHNELSALINGIITCDSNGKKIAINNILNKDKKRYSITYLLSTYLLYYQNQENFMHKHVDSEADLEASYMARLLLIPESHLSLNIDENNQWLANMFQVPYDVIEQRIEEIRDSVLAKKLVYKNEI